VLLLVVVIVVDDDDDADDDVDSMMTISVPENFRASESMFRLKVSLRSGLRPNRTGLADDFVAE